MNSPGKLLLTLSMLSALALLADDRVALVEGKATLELPPGARPVFHHAQPRGNLTILAHDRPEVRVEVDREKGDVTNYLEWNEDSQELRLKLRGKALDADLRVWVPVVTSLDLQLANGDLAVEGVQGSINARAADGDVIIEDAAGAVVIEAIDGDVELSVAPNRGDHPIALTTVDGDLRLFVRTGFRGTVAMTTVDGGISFDLGDGFNIAVEPGRGSPGRRGHLQREALRINGGGPSVLMSTVDGDITLRSR